MIEKNNEYLHSWYLLIITLNALLFLFFCPNFIFDFLLLLVVFLVYFKNGLELEKFRIFVFYAFVFSLSLFLLTIIHLKNGVTIDHAQKTMFRLFFISLLSMSSAVVIDYSKVILHLTVSKRLKKKWAYPLLLAINSIALFKDEFDRIKINARLRELPMKDKLSPLFPLLVFAIRHSQRGAMSLVTRGLNEEKSFYFSYDVSLEDKRKLRQFWLFFLLLIIGAVVFK